MTTNGISGVGGTTTGAAAALPDRTDQLGRDAFLNLLVTQLQHQDPTNPMADADFIAQLATFSQLEKLSEIADGIAKLNKALGVDTNAPSL